MRKKNGSNDLSVRYFSRFLFSYEQDSTQRHTLTVKNSHEKYKERERERENARAHHHFRFSIIIVSDLYQRDREKEWLRERFEYITDPWY